MTDKKMWALLVHMSMHFGYTHWDTLPLEQDIWEWTLESAVKSGMNTIIIDVLDGIEYASHPEIAMPGAWSRYKLRKELQRCRDMGLTPIPKLNFSANHSNWLGPYARKISTPEYYRVVDDLIKELYELFDHPEYFHIGFDEEDEEHARYNKQGYCMFRRGDLYWHDMRYVIDSVKETGAKPWMWYDAFINHHEEFQATVEKNEVLLSSWYYHQLKEEKFVPISEFKYDLTPYAGLDLKYIEDIPRLASFRKNILNWVNEGNAFAPCAWSFKAGNIESQMEYFHDGAKDEYLKGMVVSTWSPMCRGVWFGTDNLKLLGDAFKDFAEAKKKFYPND